MASPGEATKGCSTAKDDRVELRSIIWRFTREGPEGRRGRLASKVQTLEREVFHSRPPFVLFFFRSPPLPSPPVLQTVDHVIEILSAGIFLRMLYRFTISTLNTTFHVDGLYKDHSFSTSFFYRTIFIGILFLARIDNSLFFPPF